MNLNKLGIDKRGKIVSVFAKDDIRRRLMDVGFNKGAIIIPILNGSSMRAFNIKGSIIAVRNDDSSMIEVDLCE